MPLVRSMTVPALAADTPATEDQLGFTPHAQSLAATILKDLPKDQSFVIGIEGEWGEGKSSFIHFLKQAFPQGETDPLRPTLVEFNPWWFEGSDQLLRHFFDELLGQIDWSHRLRDSVRTKLNLLGSAGVRVGKVLQACSIGCVEPATIAAVAAFGKSIETGAGAIHSNSQPKSFHRLRGNAANALKTLQFKTIVFIDDLDRLPASEICELFRVIKAVADLPNIVYVIAYDRAIVASALDQVRKGRGESYLEKIIQLPYRLPKPKQQVRAEYNVKLLSSLAFLSNLDVNNQALHHIHDAFLPMPRDVKRLHACLLINQHIPDEIRMEPLDFMFLEALRLKNRMLWQETIRALLNCQELADVASAKKQSGRTQVASGRSRDDWFKWAFKGSIAENINNEAQVWNCLEFFTGLSEDERYRPHWIPERVTRLNQAGRQWTTNSRFRWRVVTALVWRYMRAGLNDLDKANGVIEAFMSCADADSLQELLLKQDASGFRLTEPALLKEAHQWLLRQTKTELEPRVAKHAFAVAMLLEKCFVRDVSREIDATDGDAELLLDYLVDLFIWLESSDGHAVNNKIIVIPDDWLRKAPGAVLELMCMNRSFGLHLARYSEDICQYFVERPFAEWRQLHALFGLLNLMGKLTSPVQEAWLRRVPEFESLSPDEAQAWRIALSRWGNAQRNHLNLKWLNDTSFSRFVQAARSSCIGQNEQVPFDMLLAAFGAAGPTDISSPA